MEKVITVENLSKSYGEKKALDGISFSVSSGMIYGLIGPNGAGKTTTIECILGTKTFDYGSISVLGQTISKNKKSIFEKIGVQFQESNYQENIKVYEICEVNSALYKNPADYNSLLKRFGIEEKRNNFIKNLSGGEKQRLFIILALIPNPLLVFLDELTTGLDTKARRDVWKILKEMKAEGITILLSSHFMEEVEFLCDEICILKKGQIMFKGTIDESIKNSPFNTFEDAYLFYTEEKNYECI